MGLLDDLMGPLRDLASVKDEVKQSFTEVGDTLTEAKDQITGGLSGVGESLKQPLEGSIDERSEGGKTDQKQ